MKTIQLTFTFLLTAIFSSSMQLAMDEQKNVQNNELKNNMINFYSQYPEYNQNNHEINTAINNLVDSINQFQIAVPTYYKTVNDITRATESTDIKEIFDPLNECFTSSSEIPENISFENKIYTWYSNFDELIETNKNNKNILIACQELNNSFKNLYEIDMKIKESSLEETNKQLNKTREVLDNTTDRVAPVIPSFHQANVKYVDRNMQTVSPKIKSVQDSFLLREKVGITSLNIIGYLNDLSQTDPKKNSEEIPKKQALAFKYAAILTISISIAILSFLGFNKWLKSSKEAAKETPIVE